MEFDYYLWDSFPSVNKASRTDFAIIIYEGFQKPSVLAPQFDKGSVTYARNFTHSISSFMAYLHTIWALQVVNKETKQVTVNLFKRVTKKHHWMYWPPRFQALNEIDDLNLVWYTIFVIGYRLRSYGFVRGGETNEPYAWACSYYYSGRLRRNYLVFRLQMARW